ncbi:hypothetical protein GCM10025770_09640 [Viridibacterium curvum]|uniref:Uncharacterized protein n=2 Tax=Viridibacterium curvum TaxID=1101404 RepID=A0ABP9QFF4_9RHOO
MQEFDTAIDFISYLKAREDLLGRAGTDVSAFGEEELMAAYLRTMDETGTRHVFFNLPPGEDQPDQIIFDGSHYRGLSTDPGYRRKKIADQISYEWDALVDRFLQYGDPGLHEQYVEQTTAETELGLRLLAAEPRFKRRQLAQSFIGALQRVEPGGRLGRLVYSGIAGETVFVFVVVSKRKSESYAEYRQYRISILHAYVMTARLMAELGTTFVGIAFDNPNEENGAGGSEDMFVLVKEDWTEDELRELERKRKELNLWGASMEYWRLKQDEFPAENQAVAMQRVNINNEKATRSNSAPDAKAKAMKRRKKSRQKSQRANRKK